MLSKLTVVVFIVGILFVVGCATHIHKVGDGPQDNNMMEARQWYVLFGLVPLNEVNTHAMAGEANNYEIRTEHTVLDFIINIFTGLVSVNSRTVTVTK